MGVCRLFLDGSISTLKPKVKTDFMARMRGVDAIVTEYAGPDCIGVAVEKPFGSFNGMDVMQGMAAVAVLAADKAGKPWVFVHLASSKKHATGNGHAKKPEMQAAALKRWGMALSPDEADAAHVAAYALDMGLFK